MSDAFLRFSNPAAVAATQNALMAKAMQSLLGICSGLIADGEINDKEVIFLRTWLRDHEECAGAWPGSIIAGRVATILADGTITAEERLDLLKTLQDITGTSFTQTGQAIPECPYLPIDEAPDFEFVNMMYCFTGRFLYGTRAACERVVLKLGAMTIDRVNKKLDYLVIGAMIDERWINTTYGRKIESAIDCRNGCSKPLIVSEKQWTEALAHIS